MEAIKGSDVNVPDAVFAWLLDGRGGVKPLEDNDVIDSQHPCWLHLNYTHPDSARWLASTPLLPNIRVELILNLKYRWVQESFCS